MSASTTTIITAHRHESSTGLARTLILAYGLLAYVVFWWIPITYTIGFVGNWLVPKSIDSGTPGPLVPSLLINAALMLVFALQHTIMARPAFKQWFTRFVPKSIERSTFVIGAGAALTLILWQWRPAPQVLWQATSPWLVWTLSLLSLSGYALAVVASFTLSHWDLFGVRQVWLRFTSREYQPVGFRLVGLYRLIRHPIMLGFLIAFWTTPTMTVGHLFFAIMVSLYIAIGVWFEERDLVREHREQYLDYRRRVRGILPIPR
jgi:protein-S-isoprenylcysteine O-methyltransferase Ste14